jgi:hypothetical protein
MGPVDTAKTNNKAPAAPGMLSGTMLQKTKII